MKTDLFNFLDIIDCELKLLRYANQNGRWLAEIDHCEIKKGPILTGTYGTGTSPNQAIADYVRLIRGKRIVINAASKPPYRREFTVPENLFYNEIS